MFVGAESYTGLSRIWPQVISGSLSVAAFIILVGYFLNKSNINIGLFDEMSSSDQYLDGLKKDKESIDNNQVVTDFQFMTIMLILFTTGIFLIGFLWSSPLYVAIYLLWYDYDLPIVVSLTGLVFIVCYIFTLILGVDLSTGLAWGVIA
jgi:hypothetical protein